jgi:hypothetical protein
MKNWVIMAKKKLDKLDAVVFSGAGQDVLKPKKQGKWISYFFDWLDYHFFKLLDYIDTKFIFKGRAVRTKTGRVRSRYERKMINFFEESNIEYVYEPLLVLGGIKLHPDFYLPRYKIYVEFWGMADFSPSYQRYMARKLRLYKKHNVPLISIYPRHLKDIRKSFFELLEKTNGKISERRNGGKSLFRRVCCLLFRFH